jgi:hypothetical protein
VQDLDGALAGERRPSGQHLEQDRPDREEVAAEVEALAAHLLGRHVPRRPHQHPRARDVVRDGERLREVGVHRPRQAEVEELHAVHGQENVRGLEVAVHDPARVQRLQGREDAEADGQGLGDAQRPALEALGERLPLQQLHGDEHLPAVLADLVDLADVRVVDRGRGPGLAPEPGPRRLVARERHRLHGDRAPEHLVVREVDDPHPALAELAGDGVVRDAAGVPLASGGLGRRRARRSGGLGGGRVRGGGRAPQPLGEGAQGSPCRLVRWLVQFQRF